MLRLDPSTGAISWHVQPVPWSLDDDPDWAGTPVVTRRVAERLPSAR